MAFFGDDIARSERMKDFSSRIREKIENLDCTQKNLNKRMSYVEERMVEIMEYLSGSQERRKARKIVFLSFAVGASSLACSIHSNIIGLSRRMLPLTTTLGLSSLAVSLYFLNKVWYASKDISEQSLMEIIQSAAENVTAPSNISVRVEDYVVGKEYMGDTDSTISI